MTPTWTPVEQAAPVRSAHERTLASEEVGGRFDEGVDVSRHLGGDQFAGEFSKTGEQVDDRARGQMLDEALAILVAAWSGEPVNYRGKHYLIK